MDPPFGPRIWTLFRTLFWTRKFFWRKKNMTAHAKTCKCSANANAFVSPGNASERTLQWPCLFSKRTFVFSKHTFAFSKRTFVFFRTHLRFFSNAPSFFFAARSLPTQARTFFRTYLTFGKNRSRSVLLRRCYTLQFSVQQVSQRRCETCCKIVAAA